jgi:gluconate 5-dehydrogenase
MLDRLTPQEAYSLKDRLAIVTGGGSGLGYAMATCFIAAGAKVIIVGRRQKNLEEAAARLGPNAMAECHDVADMQDAIPFLERIEQKYGLPSILVNNAGNHVKKTLENTSLDEFRSVLTTHLGGAFAMSRATAPLMRRANGGSIIFTASMSSIIGMPKVVAYSTAKAGYLGMVRCLATELGPDNIRVNAIAPGWIETPMLKKALAGDPERQDKILSRTPQQHFGNPLDIGWAAAFLCSPAAEFINGVLLPVDGGASIGF